MITYQKITVESREAVSITCNKCGNKYSTEDWCVTNNFTSIQSSYGYGSPKDMMTLLSHICEPCMDEIYESFVVPPQEGEAILIGEPPVMPVVYEDDDPDPPITRAPVAPGMEDLNESQEKTT